MGFTPLGGGNASTSLRAPSRLAHRQSKSSTVGSTPFGVHTLLRRFPLSEFPFDVSLIGHPYSETQTLAYGLSLSDPRADDPWQFLSASANSAAEIFLTRRPGSHSAGGFYPHSNWRIQSVDRSHSHFRSLPSSQLRWWDFLHSETIMNPTPLLGFFSTWRVGSLLRWWVPPPLGVDASNLSMGHTPSSELYQVCKYHWWEYLHSNIILQACQNTTNQPTQPEI